MPDTMQTYAPPRGNRAAWLIYGVAAVVGLAAVILALRLQSGPRTVRSFTVRNDTPYEVSIDASGVPNNSVTPLGVVAGRATQRFQNVIDEGGTWRFSLTCSGGDGGTIVRTRAELAQAGWQLRLDDGVAAACAEQLQGGH
jgi:hypothetical protein